MAKWIFNNSGSLSTYRGQDIADQSYYQIQPIEETQWANDDSLLTDIGSGSAVVSTTNDNSGHLGVAAGINHLKDINPQVTVIEQPPFAAKMIDGKSLFVRDHGASFALSAGANTDKQFNIPYPTVKFNGLEIIGGEVGDKVDLKVLDTPTGTISTVPNYMLNQFGFDVWVAPDFYHRESKYDADLIQDMKICIDYNSVSAKTVYINYIIHELK